MPTKVHTIMTVIDNSVQVYINKSMWSTRDFLLSLR